MTQEHFVWWLKGYLDGNPAPAVAAPMIAAKLKEVTTLPEWTLQWPYRMPTTWPYNPQWTWYNSSNQLSMSQGVATSGYAQIL